MNRLERFLSCLLGCLLFILLAGSACAQEVISAPPTSSPSASAVQDFNGNRSGTIPVPDASIGTPVLATPFHWGLLDARPHLLYRFLYGDGIPSRPGENNNTVIHQVSPGILLSLGSHWSLDYTPTYWNYSNSKFTDHLDQSLHLNFGSAYKDWVFNLNHSYGASSSPQSETGQQTDLESHNTSLDAFYSFSSKWSLETTINQNLRYTPNFNDVHEWSLTDWLVYQYAPRLQLSVGFTGTYDEVETGADMMSEQLLGRINWSFGEKTAIEIHGGVEDRQLLQSSAADIINPIFAANFIYKPFTYTDVKVTAARVISPSFFNNQLTERTDLRASIRQRLLTRFYFTVAGGYSMIDYVSTAVSSATLRHDDYYTVNFRVTTAILKRGSISLFYTLSENTSDNAAFVFNSNQGGVELGFNY